MKRRIAVAVAAGAAFAGVLAPAASAGPPGPPGPCPPPGTVISSEVALILEELGVNSVNEYVQAQRGIPVGQVVIEDCLQEAGQP